VQDVALTLSEAATILEPPIPEKHLRQIVTILGWQPTGWRRTGKPGHPHPEYSWADITRLHAALVPHLRR
jgi:hypothetical protein